MANLIDWLNNFMLFETKCGESCGFKNFFVQLLSFGGVFLDFLTDFLIEVAFVNTGYRSSLITSCLMLDIAIFLCVSVINNEKFYAYP